MTQLQKKLQVFKDNHLRISIHRFLRPHVIFKGKLIDIILIMSAYRLQLPVIIQ